MNLVEVGVEVDQEAHFGIAEEVEAAAAGRQKEDTPECTDERES